MIVNDINRELANKQMEPIYTMQKLEQWQGNALYRYRCIQVRKRSFWIHFYIQMLILPRHARDKHREGTQKQTTVLHPAQPEARVMARLARAGCGASWGEWCEKRVSFERFYAEILC